MLKDDLRARVEDQIREESDQVLKSVKIDKVSQAGKTDQFNSKLTSDEYQLD